MPRTAPSKRDYQIKWIPSWRFKQIKDIPTRKRAKKAINLCLYTDPIFLMVWTFAIAAMTLLIMTPIRRIGYYFPPILSTAFNLLPFVIYFIILFAAFFVLHRPMLRITARVLKAARAPHCPNCTYDLAGREPHAPCPECGLPDADPTNPDCSHLVPSRMRTRILALTATACFVAVTIAAFVVPMDDIRFFQPKTSWTPPPLPASAIPADPTDYLQLGLISPEILAAAGLSPQDAAALAARMPELRDAAIEYVEHTHTHDEIMAELDRLRGQMKSTNSNYAHRRNLREREAIYLKYSSRLESTQINFRNYRADIRNLIREYLPDFDYPSASYIPTLPPELTALHMTRAHWLRLSNIQSQLQSNPDAVTPEDRAFWHSYNDDPLVVAARENLANLPAVEKALQSFPSP